MSYLYFFTDSRVESRTPLGYTKLANILFTKELQRRLTNSNTPGNSILCLAVNPGSVQSPGFYSFLATVPILGSFLLLISRFILTSPEVGGLNPLWAASAKKVREESDVYRAAYLSPVGKMDKLNENGQDERLARELWETSEDVLTELGV